MKQILYTPLLPKLQQDHFACLCSLSSLSDLLLVNTCFKAGSFLTDEAQLAKTCNLLLLLPVTVCVNVCAQHSFTKLAIAIRAKIYKQAG